MLTEPHAEAHTHSPWKFKTFRSAGQFVPFSVDKQTIVFPGFDGGAEWGGSAVDIRTGVIYINANEMAWTGGLTANKSRPRPWRRRPTTISAPVAMAITAKARRPHFHP